MVLKLPPPPQLPTAFGGFGQQLNRWLLEIQSILNSRGTIDPDQIEGLPALFTQVATNTANIAANTTNIATNTENIAANTAAIATNVAAIVTLEARNQILNGAGVPGAGLGNNGDLYLNTSGTAGSVLWLKLGGTWTAYL